MHYVTLTFKFIASSSGTNIRLNSLAFCQPNYCLIITYSCSTTAGEVHHRVERSILVYIYKDCGIISKLYPKCRHCIQLWQTHLRFMFNISTCHHESTLLNGDRHEWFAGIGIHDIVCSYNRSMLMPVYHWSNYDIAVLLMSRLLDCSDLKSRPGVPVKKSSFCLVQHMHLLHLM